MITLWDHQRRMIDFAMSRPFCLLNSGLSTGKTAVALELARSHGVTLILSPVAALSVYRDDYETFYDDDAGFDLIVLDRGTARSKWAVLDERLEAYPDHSVAFVVSYETAARMDLSAFRFDLVVADEAHKIAAYNAKQALTLSRSLATAGRKVAMTGTGWTDRLVSLYGLFRFLSPVVHANRRKYPTSSLFGHYDDFLRDYCHTYDVAPNVRAISGYKNMDRLSAMIRPYTMVVRTTDVHDLPPVVSRTYTYALNGDLRRVYNEMHDDAVIEVNDDLYFAPNVLTQVLRLRQLSSNGSITRPDGTVERFAGLSEKVVAFRDIVERLDGAAAVVFCTFDHDVTVIRAALDDMGVSYQYLTGKMDTAQDWRDGRGQILIANLSAGSAGVRLERAAHSIYWSLSFSATDFIQSTGRTRRVGQQADTVFHHYLVADETIDRKVFGVLRAKLKQETDLTDRVRGDG